MAAPSSKKSTRRRRTIAQSGDARDPLYSIETELKYLKHFQKDEYQSIKVAFKTQDIHSDGYVQVSKLPLVFRSLGKNLSDEVFQQIYNENDLDDREDDIDFHLFLDILRKLPEDEHEETIGLKAGFKAFERKGQKDYIFTSEIFYLLESVDDTLKEYERLEIIEAIKNLESEDGKLNFEEFVQLMAETFQ